MKNMLLTCTALACLTLFAVDANADGLPSTKKSKATKPVAPIARVVQPAVTQPVEQKTPIEVTLGGFTTVRGAMFEENDSTLNRADHDFETEYNLNVDASGKGFNGAYTFGAALGVGNSPDVTNNYGGSGNSVNLESAYVYAASNKGYGKVLFGDEKGASSMFVSAPTVGDGQAAGDAAAYHNFTDVSTLARFEPQFIDSSEHSTKVTYVSPKLGMNEHSLQAAVSYVPNYFDYGSSVSKYKTASHVDVVESAAVYTGKFNDVGVKASALLTSGDGTSTKGTNDFTSYGFGSEVSYKNYALGGSWVDAGSFGTKTGQTKDQEVWTVGGKATFDKVGLSANYLEGKGYNNLFAVTPAVAVADTNYVDSFSAYGAGVSYNWEPGLTTSLEGVVFEQDRADTKKSNDGHVIMVSQKVAF